MNSLLIRALKKMEYAELRIFGTTVLMRLRLADMIYGRLCRKRRQASHQDREFLLSLSLMENVEKRFEQQSTSNSNAIRCLDAAMRLAAYRVPECYERQAFISVCRRVRHHHLCDVTRAENR